MNGWLGSLRRRLRRWLHIGVRPTAEMEIAHLQRRQEERRRIIDYYRRQVALEQLDTRGKQ